MPIKIDITLEAGAGGKPLDGVWVARMEPLLAGRTKYTYGISARIHPWETLAQFRHDRSEGHLMLTLRAMQALVDAGIREVRNGKAETVPDRLRLDGLEDHLQAGLTPDEYL